MTILQTIVSAPGVELLGLLGFFLLFIVFLLNLFLGSSTVVTLTTLVKHRSRRDYRMTADPFIFARVAPWLVVVILPAVIFPFILRMIFYGAQVPIGILCGYLLALIFLSMIFTIIHHRFSSFAAGSAAGFFLLGSALILTGLLALLMVPERWPLVDPWMPLYFSVTPFVHLLIFLSLACILGGVSLLWTSRNPLPAPGRGIPPDHRPAGGVLILAGALTLPPLLLWDHHTITGPAMSPMIFWLSGLTMIACFVLSILIIRRMRLKGRSGIYPLVVFGFFTALLISGRTTAQIMNANQEDTLWLVLEAQEARSETVAKRRELYRLSDTQIAEAGGSIFNQRCTSCHAFDQKVLGPPYNDVLDKYVEDLEALKSFLKNPVKIDPAYPAMPNPGLKDWEIEAVSRYLLDQYNARR